MKNVILIATLLITAIGYAQPAEKRMEAREKMTPEQQASIKSKKMALELDLTDDQKNQVYNVILDQAKNRPEKMSKEDRQKLSQEDRVKLVENRLDNQIAMKRELQEILTTEQYEKFDTMMTKRKKGAKERMKKRGKKRS